jgi:ribosomal protein S18 acetylase RimI-like enzyme
MAAMEIRRICADEALELRNLRLRALADAPEAFNSTLANMQAQPESFWRKRARAASFGGEQCLFIAIEAGYWLGLAGGVFEPERPNTAEIISVWVDPLARRRGLARRLIEAVSAWARENGATRLELSVTETNEAAIALYRGTGFEHTGKTQPLRSHPWLRLIEMAKELQ